MSNEQAEITRNVPIKIAPNVKIIIYTKAVGHTAQCFL